MWEKIFIVSLSLIFALMVFCELRLEALLSERFVKIVYWIFVTDTIIVVISIGVLWLWLS